MTVSLWLFAGLFGKAERKKASRPSQVSLNRPEGWVQIASTMRAWPCATILRCQRLFETTACAACETEPGDGKHYNTGRAHSLRHLGCPKKHLSSILISSCSFVLSWPITHIKPDSVCLACGRYSTVQVDVMSANNQACTAFPPVLPADADHKMITIKVSPKVISSRKLLSALARSCLISQKL